MAYIGNTPAESFASFEKQVFTIVNSQTAYTLSHSVTNENDIRLVVNNVVQEPGSGKAYTASGTTLTLSAALVNGTDEMYCVFLGRALQTVNPPNASVGTAQLADNAVTSAKLTYPLTTFSSTGIDDNADAIAITIDSSENVGIGTTSPHTKLEVYNTSNGGVITAHKNSEASGDFTGYEFHTNSSATEFKKGAIYFRANGSGYGRGDIVFCNDKVADSGNVGLADEKLRIADTGRIHTNATTSPNAHLNLIGERGQSYKAIIFEHTNGGGEVGNITTGSSSVAYNTSSDYRLKENIVAMEDATTRLKQLQPKRFNFKTDADTTVDGFLAHEVSSIVPEAISGEKDAMKTEEYKVTPEVLDKDGNVITEAVMGTREVPDYQGIDQAKLVPLLVKTIQELEARITTLEANNP
jgi:hypothetical protein